MIFREYTAGWQDLKDHSGKRSNAMNSFWQGFREGFREARLDGRAKALSVPIGGGVAIAVLVLT